MVREEGEKWEREKSKKEELAVEFSSLLAQ